VKISRDTNSGTYETFHTRVMDGKATAGDTEYVGSNREVRGRVQRTPGAIGYVGLGSVDRTVKALQLEGVSPTRETVVSGRYPIARPLFMFTNGYPKLGTHLHALVSLHLTAKGQEIVERIGFVPVTQYR
jgi:phosphate transport system substrate-binding protein